MDDLLIPPAAIVACWLPVVFEDVPAVLEKWVASASLLELWLSFRLFGECCEWRASIDMAKYGLGGVSELPTLTVSPRSKYQ
jgi:hypothetical protein